MHVDTSWNCDCNTPQALHSHAIHYRDSLPIPNFAGGSTAECQCRFLYEEWDAVEEEEEVGVLFSSDILWKEASNDVPS